MEMLREDRLELGDVLLIRGDTKFGAAISMLTKSPHSHAAIYAGNLRIFEALTTGVGYTKLRLAKVEVAQNGTLRKYCDISEYRSVSVIRCADSARPRDFGTPQFKHRFNEVLNKFEGLDYSKLSRLAEATEIGRQTPSISSAFMAAAGNLAFRDHKKELPGPFCSELVVLVLISSGFSPFRQARDPSSISPADLSNSKIFNITLVEETKSNPDPKEPNDLTWVSRLTSVQGIWPESKLIGHTKKTRNRIDNFVQELQEENRALLNQLRKQRGEDNDS